MVAKRSSRALALLLALPSAAFALGLGDIRLLSPLNAPLDAEVELVDVAPDEVNTVQAQVASRETFARYGLDWPAYLTGGQMRTVRTPDGRQMLKLKSTEAISEPFITLLVEVSWARGHLVREYTMLLDPPVYTPGQSAVASAPVSAPTTGSGVREGSIGRGADPAPAGASPAPDPGAAPPPARGASTASTEAGAASMHVVQRGETLSGIASSTAAADAKAPRTRSWMLAIYQANPRAFEQNMNVLRSGAVLRIPDVAEAAAVSPSEASAEIRRQYAAWRSTTGAPAAPAGERPGRLKLVTPSESPSVGTTPGAPSAEIGQLQGCVHDLEGQLTESKRLLELKNADLAHLQEQLAAKQGTQPAAPPARPPETAPPAAPPAAQAPAEQAPAVQAAPPPPPAAEEKPLQPAPEAPPPVSARPAPTPAAPAAGGSLFDTLKGYWWVVALLLLALVAVAASRIVRSRRATQFDDSLGRLAVAGAASESAFASRGFASSDTQPLAVGRPEPAFLVEETGTHELERPRFPAGAASAAPARHVTSDETISSETAINLDQGDPLAEADFHMAYGLYDQAADLIRIAIGREPARRDLRLKLLEVFFVWGNKDQFLHAARELADTRAEAAPGEWEKILIMGKQLAPEDPLFSGTGAVSGATAGGVDLDLEGGQSRVDFDLAGEPVAGEAPQGVDLDIGAAVGDHGTAESPTNVTDRNAALLENTFLSTTGTTRQMTARMRQDGAATGEVEGPTVEQPTFDTQEHTIQQKVETALRQSGSEQTAELAIDDLGLDVGQVDTVDQPGLAAAPGPDTPTLVAGLDDHSRRVMENAQQRGRREPGPSTGAWQFDEDELEAALTHTSVAVPDSSPTSRLAALGALVVDVDVGDLSGTHPAVHSGGVELDVGAATGMHAANGGLDLDVGSATVPDSTFAATQRLSSEDLALPDLEPVTMSEVGTKLDLARAYMDMGDPDGARNILEEV